MKELKKEIERMVNDEVLRSGAMGTESVTVEIELDEKQQEDFYNIEFKENYSWEREGDKFYISYQEEV